MKTKSVRYWSWLAIIFQFRWSPGYSLCSGSCYHKVFSASSRTRAYCSQVCTEVNGITQLSFYLLFVCFNFHFVIYLSNQYSTWQRYFEISYIVLDTDSCEPICNTLFINFQKSFNNESVNRLNSFIFFLY